MSHYDEIERLSAAVAQNARHLRTLEQTRAQWLAPRGSTFFLGQHITVVRDDGTVDPRLIGVQHAAIQAFDLEIAHTKSRIEGLRFKMVNLTKRCMP